jgi:hypothetical protein
MPVRPTTGRVRGPTTALLLALGALGTGAQAQEIEEADVELLEFLGSWELEDEDWVAVTIEDLEEEQLEGGKDAGDDERAGAYDDEK